MTLETTRMISALSRMGDERIDDGDHDSEGGDDSEGALGAGTAAAVGFCRALLGVPRDVGACVLALPTAIPRCWVPRKMHVPSDSPGVSTDLPLHTDNTNIIFRYRSRWYANVNKTQ